MPTELVISISAEIRIRINQEAEAEEAALLTENGIDLLAEDGSTLITET